MAKQDNNTKQGGKKRGFQVGPRLAKGAYTGHGPSPPPRLPSPRSTRLSS